MAAFVVKTESRGKCLRRGIGPMHIRNLESGRRRVAAVLERKSGRSADRERQATCPGRFPHTMHGEEARLELPLCNRPAIWSLSPAPPARKRTAHPSLHGESGLQLRILNHWDNMDRTVERGYAGQSLWDWEELPGTSSGRYEAYARANASIGINGTVLNNVNASPQILSTAYLEKVKTLADTFRLMEYGYIFPSTLPARLYSASCIQPTHLTNKSFAGGKTKLAKSTDLYRISEVSL